MKLSVALRETSRKYFDRDDRLDMACGLCAAVDCAAEYPDPGESAGGMSRAALFRELGMDDFNPFGPELGDYAPNPGQWEARAYMALFMAEYLEEMGR